jgi:hypothetical protein
VQPPLRQPSARPLGQAEQLPPSGPQALTETVWHRLPLQQPLGQLAELHTHWPFEHTWPAPHCGLLPQRQPCAVHESDCELLHATQAAPPVPHAEVVPT